MATLDGRAERLLIVRDDDLGARLGGLHLARITAVSPRMGLARVDIGGAADATLKLTAGLPIAEGDFMQAEVIAEAAGGKGALLRRLGPAASGRPALTHAPPTLRAALQAYAPDAEIVEGDEARDVADEAQAEALDVQHALPGGVTLTVEPTRALVAVDVDLDPANSTVGSILNINCAALVQVARLLRLKSLSGLVAIDLVGFLREKGQVHAAALDAFAADGPDVVIGPLSRFGVLELSKPRGRRPVHEQLLDTSGRNAPAPTARTLAQAAARSLERQGRFDPGARFVVVCAPSLAKSLRPLILGLGPRFSLREEVGREPQRTDIVAL